MGWVLEQALKVTPKIELKIVIVVFINLDPEREVGKSHEKNLDQP